MNKVDKQTAIEEINKWFDIIGYDESRLSETEELPENMTEEAASRKATDEMLLNAVMRGEVVFTEEHELKVNLRTPIKSQEGEILHDTLTFRHFVPMYEYNKAVKGLRADDADGRMLATISVFTNVAKSRIDRVPTKTYRILQVVAGYLL